MNIEEKINKKLQSMVDKKGSPTYYLEMVPQKVTDIFLDYVENTKGYRSSEEYEDPEIEVENEVKEMEKEIAKALKEPVLNAFYQVAQGAEKKQDFTEILSSQLEEWAKNSRGKGTVKDFMNVIKNNRKARENVAKSIATMIGKRFENQLHLARKLYRKFQIEEIKQKYEKDRDVEIEYNEVSPTLVLSLEGSSDNLKKIKKMNKELEKKYPDLDITLATDDEPMWIRIKTGFRI